MAKYIERDCLIDMISERNRNTCNGKMSCIQMKRMVESIPAADVSPVRHGRWAWTQEVCEDDYNLNCSSCGSPCPGNYDDEDETYRYHRYHYCPNCGCKMDLEG